MKLFAPLGALALALAALSTPALAQPLPEPSPLQQPQQSAVKAEVIVLHATNEGKGIDPNIGDLPQLKKPPFSSYDSYKLLDRPTLQLELGKEIAQKLPNDGKLNVVWKDVAGENKEKLVVGASIDQPDGTRFVEVTVTSARGGIFFVAGPAYKGGILVLAIRVGAQ